MHRKNYILYLVCAALFLLVGPSNPSHPEAAAKDAEAPFKSPGTDPTQNEAGGSGTLSSKLSTTGMVPDETHAGRGIHIPIQADLDLTETTASFVIEFVEDGGTDYRGVPCLDPPDGAEAAFDYAANTIWAANIHSTVPITIRACWADSLGQLLGYSGSGSAVNFIGAPEPDTYYSYSLANALRGEDLNDSYYDMNITYNSQYPYYFGLDGEPGEDEYDFVTLALHEIGHGLNFFGIVYYNTETGEGFIGSDSGYHSIYDDFMYFYDRVIPALIPLTSYTSPSVELGTKLRSDDLYFLGENAKVANGDKVVKMYAPAFWKPGSSYVHLDYETFKYTTNSLMVYSLSDGYANHNIGAVTLGILQDLGWPDRLEPYPPGIVWASFDTFTDKVRISWLIASSATTYQVFRNTIMDPESAAVLTASATENSYDDLTADPDQLYYYWVRACNIAGCSEFSEIPAEGRRASIPVPEAPEWVNASDGIYPDEVRITWHEPEGATYYKVYRDLDDGIYGAELLLPEFVFGNEKTDSDVFEFLYFYWVRACNNSGCSGYSEPDSGYITPTKPLPPTGLEASDGTDKNNVYLSWNPSAGDKINYMIYRNTTDNSSDAKLLVDNHGETSYADASAAYYIDYYYWVRACDPDDNCSYYSTSDLGYTQRSAPEKPLGVTASDGEYPDQVHLYWNAPSYTDYYQIFRNTTNTPTDAIEMENRHPITSYDDLQVVTGATYYYFIKACNTEGCSSYSSSESGYAGSRIFIPLIQKP